MFRAITLLRRAAVLRSTGSGGHQVSDKDRWKKLAVEALLAAEETADQQRKRTLLLLAAAYDELAQDVAKPLRRSPGK